MEPRWFTSTGNTRDWSLLEVPCLTGEGFVTASGCGTIVKAAASGKEDSGDGNSSPGASGDDPTDILNLPNLAGKIGEEKQATENSGADVASGPAPENAWSTFERVQAKGSPFPGYKGGSTFENNGSQGAEILPSTTSDGDPIGYREWDVNPNVKGVDRGAERIVTGSVNGKIVSGYYASNHYISFVQFFGGSGG